MNKFLRKFFLFFTPIFVLGLILVAVFIVYKDVTYKDLPAPNLSTSYSFNEKVAFSKNKTADIITIGSSMGLNNVSSDVIVDKFKSYSYLNLSSWGFTINEVYHFLKFQNTIYKPKVLIISSNIVDFADIGITKAINYSNVREYLNSKSPILEFINRGYTFKYFIDIFEYGRMMRTNIHNYDCSKYDNYGAVLMDSTGFNISKKRWNEIGLPKTNAKSYEYLDSIALLCNNSGIQLYFFQSPYRKGLYLDKNFDKSTYHYHIAKVKKIIENRKQTFVNASITIWDDYFFVDAIHFNSIGAKKFTEYCVDRIELKN